SLLEALANVLQTQQGYVESAVAKEVGSAPSKDPNVNLMLGYPEGRDPRGTLLGRYFHDAKNSGRDVIVFHPEAFEVARQKSPHLIQHGQTQSRSWLSLWNEGLTADGLWTRQKTSAGKSLNTVDIRSGGTRIKGIPVFLDTLYGLDEEDRPRGGGRVVVAPRDPSPAHCHGWSTAPVRLPDTPPRRPPTCMQFSPARVSSSTRKPQRRSGARRCPPPRRSPWRTTARPPSPSRSWPARSAPIPSPQRTRGPRRTPSSRSSTS